MLKIAAVLLFVAIVNASLIKDGANPPRPTLQETFEAHGFFESRVSLFFEMNNESSMWQ
jgi:hypothetical protein